MTPSRIALPLTVFVGVLIRTIVAAQGWFYWDDLTLMAQARSTPLAELLFQQHDGHLMPGAWLLIWAFTHFSSWPAAIALLALGQLAAALAVAYAAWRIAPRNAWWVTALYLVGPLTLPATTWAAAAVNSLPLHAAAAIWLAHGWVYLTRRRPADLAIVVVAILAACLFNERALFLAPVSLVLIWGWARARREAMSVNLIPAFLAPVIAWGAVYALVVGNPAGSSDGPGAADMLSHGYLRGFLPTLVGAPWTWERWQPGPPFADPHIAAIIFGAFVAIALLIWASRCRGALAMLTALAYPLLPLVALAIARSGPDTAAEIAQTLRHFGETQVLLALTLGVLAPKAPRIPLAIFVVSSLVSTVTYAQSWADQPARGYFTTLNAEINARNAPILDQAVPLEVLLPVVYPNNLLSRLLPEGQVTQDTKEPTLIDADGHLHAASLAPARSTAWEPGCLEAGQELQAPLDGPLWDRDWVVLLNLMSAGEGAVTVKIGDGDPVTLDVDGGLSQTYVQVSGGGDQLTLRADDTSVCFGQAEAGLLVVS